MEENKFEIGLDEDLHMRSNKKITWQHGDASIVEGEGSGYSLGFKTYDGSSNSLVLRLEGNNGAYFTGDITASGNISSSGNITTTGDITATGDIRSATIGMTNIVTNRVPYFNGTQLDDSVMYSRNGGIDVEGNITASGNISASGNVLLSGNFETSQTGSMNHIIASDKIITPILSASNYISGGSARFTDTVRVEGDVYAQSFHTNNIVAATSTGSNVFGDTGDDIHRFTGSLQVSGGDIYSHHSMSIGFESPVAPLYVFGDVSSSGDLTVGTNAAENIQLTLGLLDSSGVNSNVVSGSQMIIGSAANASSSIRLISANKYWDIKTTKSGPNLVNSALHFIASATERIVFASDGKVGINNLVPTKMLTVEGDISASGALMGVNSASTAHGWTDGYHGNDDFIALTPQDFNFGSDGARTHGVYTDDDGATSRVSNAFTNLYASKIIPKGFTATGVRVNCSATIASSVTPHDGNITNGSINDHTAGATNADVAFSGTDPVGDGEVYVIVEFNPNATTDEIQGGKIYITRT